MRYSLLAVLILIIFGGCDFLTEPDGPWEGTYTLVDVVPVGEGDDYYCYLIPHESTINLQDGKYIFRFLLTEVCAYRETAVTETKISKVMTGTYQFTKESNPNFLVFIDDSDPTHRYIPIKVVDGAIWMPMGGEYWVHRR